jgi:hypothetical protein
MQRFTGMTLPVAEYLTDKVFCILEDPTDDSQRVGAREFGTWIKDLPALLADTSAPGHKRVISTSSIQGFPIAQSVPASHHPSSRQASIHVHAHAAGSRPRSRAPSLGPAYETDGSELPTVFDQELEERDGEGMYSRSTSNKRNRKRGARGKGSGAPAPLPPNDKLETLATASQSLAREISKTSRSSSKHRGDLPSESPPPVPVIRTPPVVTKKASKWRLGFGRNSSSGEKALASPVDDPSSLETRPAAMSTTASNVTNLVMGLDPPTPSSSGISQSKTADADQSSTCARGRRPKTPAAPVRRGSPPSMFNVAAFANQPDNSPHVPVRDTFSKRRGDKRAKEEKVRFGVLLCGPRYDAHRDV